MSIPCFERGGLPRYGDASDWQGISLSGKNEITTVLGPIKPESAGRVLMHEHILAHLPHITGSIGGAANQADRFEEAPLTLATIGGIRYGRVINAGNCSLDDLETAVAEVDLFKRAGGNLIVDASSIGVGRNPAGLAEVARATGIQIVMGSSFYVDGTWPPDAGIRSRSQADIRDQIVRDLTEGVDDTGIRAGLIGEVGCSWPITDDERKVLFASAEAQRATGAALMVHPGRASDAPMEIISILSDAGADIERTIICHLDRTIADKPRLAQLAGTGCYLEYDLFGMENSYYPWSLPVDMPNDAGRIDWLRWLIEEGHLKKILVSHDVCFKHQLVSYGGFGYAHILANVVPLMHRKGMTEADVQMILTENPRRILTIAGEHG
jgi:phosphotriesterase-related protein